MSIKSSVKIYNLDSTGRICNTSKISARGASGVRMGWRRSCPICGPTARCPALQPVKVDGSVDETAELPPEEPPKLVNGPRRCDDGTTDFIYI
eukprot:g12629.t1